MAPSPWSEKSPSRARSSRAPSWLGLFGAITSKPAAEAEAELRPDLQGLGLRYESPVLRLRRELGLDVCLRPCRTLEGHPRNHVRRRGAELEEPRVDTLLVTQNNEGLYSGVEWKELPDELRRALDKHPGTPTPR